MARILMVVWFVLGLVAGGAVGVGLLFPVMLLADLVPHGPGYNTRCSWTFLGLIAVLGCGAVAAWFAVSPLPVGEAAFVRGAVTGAWCTFSLFVSQLAFWAALSYDGG